MSPDQSHPGLRGLYLILDQSWASRCSLPEVLGQAIEAGVRLVQYRNKEGSIKDIYRQVLELRTIAADSNMLFFVNDRCDVALAVEADGVHLGQSDLPIALARKVVGEHCLIGISTHTPEQVAEATAQGADYLGFGPLYPTSTKKDHEAVVGIQGMTRIRPLTSLPVFCIGGITAESVPEIIEAGASGVAVASGILGATDTKQAIQQFMRPFH